MARRGAWLLLLALPSLVLPAPAPSPIVNVGELDSGGGAIWGVLPALGLLLSLATIIIGCSWCHRYKNCKLFGGRRASIRSAEVARARADSDDAREPPAEGERGPVLLSRGPLPPDNNNVSEDNNNGPISAREMQNIENNNAAVYIISENENRNALSAARASAAVRLNASRESVVEFEPLPVDITPQHQPRVQLQYDDWFAPQYEELPRSQLQYLREIGRGSFGRIVEGEVESLRGAGGARTVAVKILEQHATQADRARFLREAQIFRDLRHENILALLARNLAEDPWLLVFELCSMDLQQYLIGNRPKMALLNERGTPLRLKCDIAAGLAYLHSHGYVYGSLWSGGVLVSSMGGEGEVRARLGHYGDARAPRLAPWSAPEVMAHPGFVENNCSEVWSLGVVLWEVCSWGELPPATLPASATPPLLPCPYRDHLYQVMQLCWNVNLERRPTTAQVHALLNHLYTSHLASQHAPQDPHASSDFEDRWQRLKPNSIPKVDEHVAIVHADTHSLSSRYTRSQDNFRVESNLLAIEREAVASRSSSIISDTLLNNKSDSLTNLHGSLEDMRNVNYINPDATVVEGKLEASAEQSLSAEPEHSSCEDLSEKVDPWLAEVIANGADVGYYRDVSDVIKNLDSILNSEKTSSSESSHQASPSRENLALHMRDVPPPPCSLVKSPGIADFQNILEAPSSDTQTREEDECVAGGLLHHSFERNPQNTISPNEQCEVISLDEDNAIKRTLDNESHEVSRIEIIESKENITLPSPKDSDLANSSVSRCKFECETKDCRESCDNVILRKTCENGNDTEMKNEVKEDTYGHPLSTNKFTAELDAEVISGVEPQGYHSEEAEYETNSISDTKVLPINMDSTVYMDLKGAQNCFFTQDNNNSLNKSVEKDISKLCRDLNDISNDKVIDVKSEASNDSTRYLELPTMDLAAFLHAEKVMASEEFNIIKLEISLKSPSIMGNVFTSTPKAEEQDEHMGNISTDNTEIQTERSIEESENGATVKLEKQILLQNSVCINTPKDVVLASCETNNKTFQLPGSKEIENLISSHRNVDNLQESTSECSALNHAITSSNECFSDGCTPDSTDRGNKTDDFLISPVTCDALNESFLLTPTSSESEKEITDYAQNYSESVNIIDPKPNELRPKATSSTEPIDLLNNDCIYNSVKRDVDVNSTNLCRNVKDNEKDKISNVTYDISKDIQRTDRSTIDIAAFIDAEKMVASQEVYINNMELSNKSTSILLDHVNVLTSTPKIENTIESINTECPNLEISNIPTEILKEDSSVNTQYSEPDVNIKVEKQNLPQVCSTPTDTNQARTVNLSEEFELTDCIKISSEKLNFLTSGEESRKDINPEVCADNKNYNNQLIKDDLNASIHIRDSEKVLKDFSSERNVSDASLKIGGAAEQKFDVSDISVSNKSEEEMPDYGPGITITKLAQKHAVANLESFHQEAKPAEDGSVVLGPFENCTLDYFTGIKTETQEPVDSDLSRKEQLAFSSNFVDLNSENVRTEQIEGPDSLPTDSIERLPEDRPFDTIKADLSPNTPPNSPGNYLSSSPQNKYLICEHSLSNTEPSLSPIPMHSMYSGSNMLDNVVDLSHIEIQLTTKLAMAENENNMNIEYSGPFSIDELPPPDSLETVGLEDAGVDTPPECNECPREGGVENREEGRHEGYWLDEACVRALRNELELKLPLAQASGCEPIDDMPIELPPPPAEAECDGEASGRDEVIVCYPGALSPILEETDPQLSAYHNNLNWVHSQRTDSSESYPEPCNNSTDEITDLMTAMKSTQRDQVSADAAGQSDDSAGSRTFTIHKEEASNEISMSADSLNGTEDGTLKDVMMPSTSVQIPSPSDAAVPTELCQVKSPETECERISQISACLISPTVDSCKFPTDSNDIGSNISKLSRPTLPSDVKSSKASDAHCLSKATSIDSWCSNDTLFNVEDNFDELAIDSDAEECAPPSRSSGTLTHNDDNGGPTYIVHSNDSDKCDSFTPDSITENYTYTKVRTETPTRSVAEVPEKDEKLETLDEVIETRLSQPVNVGVESVEKGILLNTTAKVTALIERHDEIITDKLVNNKAGKSDDVMINELLSKDLTNSHDLINNIESLNRDVSVNSDDFTANTFAVKKHVDSPIEVIRDSSSYVCLDVTPPICNNNSEKAKDSILKAEVPRPIVSKMDSVDINCFKEDFLEDNDNVQIEFPTTENTKISSLNGVGTILSPEQHFCSMSNAITSTPLVQEDKEEPAQSESQEIIFKKPQNMYVDVPHFDAFVNSVELRPQDMSPFTQSEGGTRSDLNNAVRISLHNGSKEEHNNFNSNITTKNTQTDKTEEKTSEFMELQSSAQNTFQDLLPVDPDRGSVVCSNKLDDIAMDNITGSSIFPQPGTSVGISNRLLSNTVMSNGLDCGIEKNNDKENTSSVELSSLKEEKNHPLATIEANKQNVTVNPNETIPSVIVKHYSGDVHTYIPVQAEKSGLEFRNDNCPSYPSFENSVHAKSQDLSSVINQNCTDVPNASNEDLEYSSFERSAANKTQDLSSVRNFDSQSNHLNDLCDLHTSGQNSNKTLPSFDSHKTQKKSNSFNTEDEINVKNCSIDSLSDKNEVLETSSQTFNKTNNSNISGQNINEAFETFDSHKTQRKPEMFDTGDESDRKDSSSDSSKDRNEDFETSHNLHNNISNNKSNEKDDNSNENIFEGENDSINPQKANENILNAEDMKLNIVQVHTYPAYGTNKEDIEDLVVQQCSLTEEHLDFGFCQTSENKNDSLVSENEDNPHSEEILDREISSTASTGESEPTTREMDSLENHLEIINEEVIIHNEINKEISPLLEDRSIDGKMVTKKVDVINDEDIVQAIEELDQVIGENSMDRDVQSASPCSCRSDDGGGLCEGRMVLDSAEICSITDSFIEHEKSLSEINACLPLLGDIRFTGPSCDYMSTSFNQESPSEDASMMMLESELRKAEENAERLGAASEAMKEWESESEDSQTNSTSSGEFIWKRQQNGGAGSELGSIAEGSEGEGEGEGSDADGSEGDEVEFVPSSWDCRAAPSKSSMKSLQQSPLSDSKKRVVFKRQKYHCVYEYPREMVDDCDVSAGESRMLHSPYLPDYSAYAGSLWEALSASGADLSYSYPTTGPVHLYHLPGDATFSPNYGLPDEDFFISSSARPFESLGIMSTTSQFFPGLHATLKAVGTLERGDSPDDEGAEEFPPPPSPLAPITSVTDPVNTHIPHLGSLDFTTPDSGVEDVTPGCAVDDNLPTPIAGQLTPPPVPTSERSRLKLRAPEGSTSSSESPSPSSPCWESLGGLRHTRDRLKLDLPPSPLQLGSSASRHGQRVFNFLAADASPANREPPALTPLVMSDETPVVRSVPLPSLDDGGFVVPEPTFSTFGKTKARNASAAVAEAKPLLIDDECHTSAEESRANCESEVIVLRNKSLLEAVKGEGTVLDSGDEDSGIESSAKTTLERNPPHHSAA